MRIKTYKEFVELNELRYGDHWLARTSLNKKDSRVVGFSPTALSGWECNNVVELNDSRKSKTKILIHEFLELSQISKNDFDDKIKIALNELTNSRVLEKIKYKNHVFFCLGKIAFEHNNKLYSPYLEVKDEKNNKVYEGGTEIWGVAKHDTAITLLYYENPSIEKLQDKAYNDPIRNISTERFPIKGEEIIKKQEYCKEYLRIDYPLGRNFIVTIPQVSNWKSEISIQIIDAYNKEEHSIKKPTEFKKLDTTTDKDLLNFKKHLKNEITAILDKGVKLIGKDNSIKVVKSVELAGRSSHGNNEIMTKFKAIAMVLFDDGKTTFIKKDQQVSIITPKDQNILKDGMFELPLKIKEDDLVMIRVLKTRSIGEQRGKITLYGDTVDYYVARKKGNMITDEEHINFGINESSNDGEYFTDTYCTVLDEFEKRLAEEGLEFDINKIDELGKLDEYDRDIAKAYERWEKELYIGPFSDKMDDYSTTPERERIIKNLNKTIDREDRLKKPFYKIEKAKKDALLKNAIEKNWNEFKGIYKKWIDYCYKHRGELTAKKYNV